MSKNDPIVMPEHDCNNSPGKAQKKTKFQSDFEVMLEINKRIFEDVELERISAESAAIASANLWTDFINNMRYPNEAKAVVISKEVV